LEEEHLEQNDIEEAKGKRGWKRILLFFLFFFILTSSLFYYVLIPRIFVKALRRDSTPSDAYVIPWKRPDPSIEILMAAMNPWNVDTVMAGALQLNMTFHIITRNETRLVPSTLYLSHDAKYLYIGGEFRGMFMNPASGSNLTLPNYFQLLLDTNNDGMLKFPETGSRLSVLVYGNSWRTSGWYRDLVWVDYSNFFHRAIWMFGDDYYDEYLSKPPPTVACSGAVSEYDNSTGTLTILFARNLRLPEIANIDALQMRPGERWTMGFLLELGYATWYGPMSDFVDGWPRNVYPYLSNDSSWWPKLVIDLANPPADM
jgi:hypothetical protein